VRRQRSRSVTGILQELVHVKDVFGKSEVLLEVRSIQEQEEQIEARQQLSAP
jgi:hypothetical protein